jgi:hypothetical protein
MAKHLKKRGVGMRPHKTDTFPAKNSSLQDLDPASYPTNNSKNIQPSASAAAVAFDQLGNAGIVDFGDQGFRRSEGVFGGDAL